MAGIKCKTCCGLVSTQDSVDFVYKKIVLVLIATDVGKEYKIENLYKVVCHTTLQIPPSKA
jgi:hypothetical protein